MTTRGRPPDGSAPHHPARARGLSPRTGKGRAADSAGFAAGRTNTAVAEAGIRRRQDNRLEGRARMLQAPARLTRGLKTEAGARHCVGLMARGRA